MRLLNAARDHLRQLLGVVQTRLELVGLELADARDHLIALLAYAAVAVFFAGVAVVTTLAWLLMAYWEQRLLIAGVAATLFALLAVFSVWRAFSHAQSGTEIFADSLQALQADRAALRPPVHTDDVGN
ncbi:MAG: phage holin family protein [Fluviibacter sp.]